MGKYSRLQYILYSYANYCVFLFAPQKELTVSTQTFSFLNEPTKIFSPHKIKIIAAGDTSIVHYPLYIVNYNCTLSIVIVDYPPLFCYN